LGVRDARQHAFPGDSGHFARLTAVRETVLVSPAERGEEQGTETTLRTRVPTRRVKRCPARSSRAELTRGLLSVVAPARKAAPGPLTAVAILLY
jgi:hypothetical protein